MRSFSRHCYNGFCLRIENGGHTEKRKMFLSFMWSKVEAFQIWENTVINLQPPRIMWCYKWRQLQTSFLQQEQNSIPPPWIHHCLSSSSWPNVLSNVEPGCLSPAFQGMAAQHRGFWYSHTTIFANKYCLYSNRWDSEIQRSCGTGWHLVHSWIPSYGRQPHQLTSRGVLTPRSVWFLTSVALQKVFRCFISLMVKQWLFPLLRFPT